MAAASAGSSLRDVLPARRRTGVKSHAPAPDVHDEPVTHLEDVHDEPVKKPSERLAGLLRPESVRRRSALLGRLRRHGFRKPEPQANRLHAARLESSRKRALRLAEAAATRHGDAHPIVSRVWNEAVASTRREAMNPDLSMDRPSQLRKTGIDERTLTTEGALRKLFKDYVRMFLVPPF